MAAAKDIKSDQMGGEDSAFPLLLSFPVAANTILYGGTMAATDASGNAVPASATASLRLWGRVDTQADNRTATNPGFGAAGDKRVTVRPGVFCWANDTGAGAISNADRGQYVFAKDDNVVSKSDGGGTYPIAGYVIDVPATGQANAGKVFVAVGMARPEGLAGSAASAFTARAVATSIAAYDNTGTATITGTANGALGTQDGVSTLAVGDVILLPRGVTNVQTADVGPWQIVALGGASAKYSLTRPAWWRHGGAMLQGAVIEVGGEGTLFGGCAFKAFAATGQIIGTNDPVFWPNIVTQAVTLASGTLAAALTTIPVRSATKTAFVITSNPATAPHASTRTWRISALTAGNIGTASIQMVAESAPGTTNASDVGQYNITAINW